MKARHKRSALIGILASAVFVWAAIDRFDVPPAELAWLLLYCVIGVVTVALLAGICVGLLVAGRRLLGRSRDELD